VTGVGACIELRVRCLRKVVQAENRLIKSQLSGHTDGRGEYPGLHVN